jgi:hypothetical protein
MFLTASQFLTMGFGPGVVGLNLKLTPKAFWPFVCGVTLLLYAITIAMLALQWKTRADERTRSGGLILFLGATFSLTLGLCMGREGFETRYVTLSVPALCAAYIAWSIYGSRRFAIFVPGIIFLITLLAFIPNVQWGLSYARDMKSHLRAFESDMIAGTPRYQLISRYNGYLHPHDGVLMDYMPMLRDAGAGSFARLYDDPAFE